MKKEDRCGQEGGPAMPAPEHPEAGKDEDGQEDIDRHEPGRPLSLESPGPHEQGLGHRLPGAREQTDEPALDLGGGGRGKRRPRRPEIEGDPGREHGGGNAERGEAPLQGQRAAEPEQGHEQDRLGAGERGRADEERGEGDAARGMSAERPGDEEGGQRHLHPGERSPRHRRAQRRHEPGAKPQEGLARPLDGEPTGQPCAAHGRGHARDLDPRDVSARDREEPGEEDRPEGRRRARDGDAGVVGEAPSLGEIARELEMDPRIVEGKARGAQGSRDLALAEKVEADGGGEPRQDQPGGAAALQRAGRTKV